MKLLKHTLIASLAFFLCTGFGGMGEKLKSSNYKTVAGVKARIPYAKYVKYYGYVDKDVKPDGKYKNKDAFYIYVWIPAAMDEIGISMVSPAQGKPKKKDFAHAKFKAGMKKDKKAYFDTYLVLDRMNVVDPKKIKSGGSVQAKLTHNDDSSELPKNPGGQAYNSLLRHKSVAGNPQKALVRGLYRISFTSFRSAINGSYLATIGSNVPGIKMATSLEELHKIVNK